MGPLQPWLDSLRGFPHPGLWEGLITVSTAIPYLHPWDTAPSSSLESPQSLSLCLQPISGPRRDWKPSLHFMRGLSGQHPEETHSHKVFWMVEWASTSEMNCFPQGLLWSECAKSLQSCLTLCDPMGCNPPGSSFHGILQARIQEWVAMLSFKGIFLTQGSNPRLLTLLSFLPHEDTVRSCCLWNQEGGLTHQTLDLLAP